MKSTTVKVLLADGEISSKQAYLWGNSSWGQSLYKVGEVKQKSGELLFNIVGCSTPSLKVGDCLVDSNNIVWETTAVDSWEDPADAFSADIKSIGVLQCP